MIFRSITSNLPYQYEPPVGSTGEYVDMLPANAQTGNNSVQQFERKRSSEINEDYVEIEEVAIN